MSDFDWEGEGLLEGLSGKERDARRELLDELAGEGVELEELRTAIAEDRLALLPIERILSGGGERLTAAELSERTGVPEEFLERNWRALGMALAEDDAAAYTARDVEAVERVGILRDAGVPDEAILEVARLLGMTMSQLAAANRSVIAEAFTTEDDTELDVAHRFADVGRTFLPLIGDSLSYVLALHLREQIRHDAFSLSDDAGRRASQAAEVTVCFADMVDFTQLGESLEPDALGRVTGRLSELAAAVVEPPVRLVKLIGDAAMIVGPETQPVLECALDIVDAAADEGEDFPLLRAGVASGTAIPRSGDWYGRPVNLASRITAIARPGSVLAAEEVHDALEESYDWSFAGSRKLKGIDGSIKVFRARRNN